MLWTKSPKRLRYADNLEGWTVDLCSICSSDCDGDVEPLTAASLLPSDFRDFNPLVEEGETCTVTPVA